MVRRNSAPMVNFNGIVTRDPSHSDSGYILGFGQRKKGAQMGHLRLAGERADPLYEQIASAKQALDSNRLDNNAYSLDDPKVADMGKSLAQKNKQYAEYLEIVLDVFRPFVTPELEAQMPRLYSSTDYKFHFNPEVAAANEDLASAGVILSDDRSIVLGNMEMQLCTHLIEPYILAVSALRSNGFDAYPASANLFHPEHGKMTSPVITIIDMETDSPLTVFSLMRDLPPFSELEIMSDVAVDGVLHAALAENKAKKLAIDIVERNKSGGVIPRHEIEVRIESIAKQLFFTHSAWPGTKFVSDALTTLVHNTMEAFIAIQIGEMQGKELPVEFAVPGAIEQYVQGRAMQMADSYGRFAQEKLKNLIDRG